MTKYLVSHKGVSILFDDHRKCSPSESCGRQEMIEEYLKGTAKLLATVNVNDDWIAFGKHMQIVVEELMKRSHKRGE